MGRDGIGSNLVPVLIDVKLAVSWPVGAEHPEGWPGAANGLGKVAEVGNEEAGVVLFHTFEPHTASAGITHTVVGIVDANVHVVGVGLDQTKLLRGVLAAIIDESIGRVDLHLVAARVVTRKELELGEKVRWIVRVCELVLVYLGSNTAGQGQNGSAQREDRGCHHKGVY